MGYCHSTVTSYCWDLPAGSTPRQYTDSGCYFTATGATVFQTCLLVFHATTYSAAPSESAHVQTFQQDIFKGPKGTKKERKIFTVRNVDPAKIQHKRVIRHQLTEKVTTCDFEIGFLCGTNVIRIWNQEDLSELWSGLRKSGSRVTVWCDGLMEKGTSSRKHVHVENSEEEKPSKQRKQMVRSGYETRYAIELK